MDRDLTRGPVMGSMLAFAGPMILGNFLQQFYNIADMLIVGRFLGASAMAAVGSAYTLMTFLTSIIIGLCMGSGSVFSFHFGRQDGARMKEAAGIAFTVIGIAAAVMNVLVFLLADPILVFLRIPAEILDMMRAYSLMIFAGIMFVFLYNFFAYLLRAAGDSVVPLYFLGGTSVLNIALDLLFVVVFHYGIVGAAAATVLSQALSGVGIAAYTLLKRPSLRFSPAGRRGLQKKAAVGEILRFSCASSVQQSVMNFGILMIQGLVNSFGVAVMAAFTAAVKIDSFAYMPAQEFGNAFSLFISQNHGAGKASRVKTGTYRAMGIVLVFCVMISLTVCFLGSWLMLLFVAPEETEIIRIGAQYLRIEGACYCGIGLLFLLYGYYRGIGKPEMSLLLTVISLGTRVLLAYLLAPIASIGILGIWWAIPVGWLLADAVGIAVMVRRTEKK